MLANEQSQKVQGNSRPSKYLVIVLQEVYRTRGGQQTLAFIFVFFSSIHNHNP